jgi:hypothetical protein
LVREFAIFAVAAVPGYALAVWRMDRIGHRGPPQPRHQSFTALLQDLEPDL